MSFKDAVETASYVAAVIIAAIAVAPLLHRAWYLLTTDPTTSAERLELVSLYSARRMGPVQWAWLRFLWWCRRQDDEVLTWKERLNRHLVCPAQGHRFGQKFRPAGLHEGVCDNCHYVALGESEDDLERMERSGKVQWRATQRRTRARGSLEGLSDDALDAIRRHVDAEIGRRR